MAGRVSGRVALITGGGSGIGRATAIVFAREGAKVAIADYNRDGGEQTARMIKDAGGEALFIEANVAIAKQVEAMVARTVETYGRMDCAFNNAGIEGEMGHGAPINIADCSEENWARIIAINLTGVFLCMKYEIPQMLKHGGGSIVNTASAAGLIGLPGGTAYVASKHGVAGLTKSAALEYAKSGIRINAVCPGFIRTAMVERAIDGGSISEEMMIASEPIGRIGRPEEIANAVLFLCSDDASYVTGLPMPVDGGYVAQ
ncbi:MAG: SDR family oxidoreductase [Candidatus Binatus sp.]|jgi:NAD(P)-dependent dehydrogenase (short-subunit alcohol dehydrogenase family)